MFIEIQYTEEVLKTKVIKVEDEEVGKKFVASSNEPLTDEDQPVEPDEGILKAFSESADTDIPKNTGVIRLYSVKEVKENWFEDI